MCTVGCVGRDWGRGVARPVEHVTVSSEKQSPAERFIDRRVAERGLRPRVAASVISMLWLVAIIVFGILEHLIDKDTFTTVWWGMWWATQTVTTVGYGDIVPQSTAGQLIGVVLMVGGLSLFAVLTGWITTAFVTRAQAEKEAGPEQELRERLEQIGSELTALREQVARLTPPASLDS